MSMIFIDGFDHYNVIREKWTVTNTFDNPTFVAGRFGGQALKKQFQNAQGTVQRSLGAQTEVFWGMAFNPPGLPTAESMWRIKDSGGTTICSVQINSANSTISIVAGGFISTSPADAITVGAWQYIEVHYIPKSATGQGGIAELRVDEVVVALIDGALFKTTTETSDDILSFQFTDNGTNSPRYLYDDFYILNADGAENNGYLGDVRVSVLYPKADGGITTMNPLSGNDNFAMVDETVSDEDTSYVDSNIIGASDDYVNQTFGDIGVTPSTVHAVQVSTSAKKTDVGPMSYKNEVVIATVRFSDDINHVVASGTYQITTYIRDTDPSDSGTWTEAKVDAVGSAFSIIDPP